MRVTIHHAGVVSANVKLDVKRRRVGVTLTVHQYGTGACSGLACIFFYTNNGEIQYMWPFSAFMQPKGMLSTKELQVGKTYKQRNTRLAAGYDPCKTLTRKKHLRDGKYYELTFHIGKKPSGRFYNSTDNPIFKRCATRRRRRSH